MFILVNTFFGFILVDMRRDVQEIFRMTPHDKQVMMFSATLSKEIRPVCKKFMQDVMFCGQLYLNFDVYHFLYSRFLQVIVPECSNWSTKHLTMCILLIYLSICKKLCSYERCWWREYYVLWTNLNRVVTIYPLLSSLH